MTERQPQDLPADYQLYWLTRRREQVKLEEGFCLTVKPLPFPGH